LSVDKLNNDRHRLTDGVNNIRGVYAGSVQSSGQIQADTVGEENMADDANPRVRTAEGASCTDLVYSGFLPTTSSSLVLTIPSGVAYPDGYRVEKTTSTASTLQASKWTYKYILTSGSFAENVVTIGSSTPTAPANSALLFRASTDATTINAISDLRRTSCAGGPFSAISDVTGEATLSDLFANGIRTRRYSLAGRTPSGYAEGAFVSYDTATTFKVTSGSLYINGKYRAVSQDVTVTTSADAPASGGSGIDSGSVTTNTRYYVYGVADQDEVGTFSVSYSTSASAPAGTTNYRLIGSINTDATSLFTSKDTVTAHGISQRELPAAWVVLSQSGSQTILDSFNISGIADGGVAGDTVITIDSDLASPNYAVYCTANEISTTTNICAIKGGTTPGVGSFNIAVRNDANSQTDATYVSVLVYGDTRK